MAKILALAAIVLVSFLTPHAGNAAHLATPSEIIHPQGLSWWAAIAAALSGAFWGYEGWNTVTFVAGEVKQNEASIGYVELIFAANNNISYGDVKNPAGKVIHASEASVTAAAATLTDIPDDLRVSITNAPGDEAYPISSFTWVLVYPQHADPAKGKALADYLNWCIHDGQGMCAPMHYAPMPAAMVKRCEAKISGLK